MADSDEKNALNNIADSSRTDENKSGIEPDLLDLESLKDLPSEAKKVLEVGMAMHRIGPMPNPLTEKITEKHIDKILELTERDQQRSFRDAGENRKYFLYYLVIFVALFVFLTIFLIINDKDIYKEIIKLFAVFAGGFGGGFGLKSYMNQKK